MIRICGRRERSTIAIVSRVGGVFTENQVRLGNEAPSTWAEDTVGQESEGIEDVEGCESQLLCP